MAARASVLVLLACGAAARAAWESDTANRSEWDTTASRIVGVAKGVADWVATFDERMAPCHASAAQSECTHAQAEACPLPTSDWGLADMSPAPSEWLPDREKETALLRKVEEMRSVAEVVTQRFSGPRPDLAIAKRRLDELNARLAAAEFEFEALRERRRRARAGCVFAEVAWRQHFKSTGAVIAACPTRGRGETYGEIELDGIRRIARHWPASCPLTNASTFYDVGSGAGKMVAYVGLVEQVGRAHGVEIDPCRHALAEQSLADLCADADPEARSLCAGGTVRFAAGDATAPGMLTGATHVYMSSLCFGEELLRSVVARARADSPGLHCIASLRAVPRHVLEEFGFEPEGSSLRQVQTSWSSAALGWSQAGHGGAPSGATPSSVVHFYRVRR